jgi:serine-type D-Ala-D-Ala carboxypeptidase (penicillin-binding protein 5/6)
MTTPTRPSDDFADLVELLDTAPGVAALTDEQRARRRRRRIGVWSGVVAVLLLLGGGAGGYVAWALNAALPEPVVTSGAPAAPVTSLATLALPEGGVSSIVVSGAEEYFAASASDAGAWAAGDTNERRPMASITKLITALVVLDRVPLTGPDDLGPTLTFSEADNDLYDAYYVRGATIAPMPTGSSMALRDALGVMLIPSACNYAEVIARWAFGSQAAFLAAARDWLAANGMSNTTIVEPTGLDPANTSTAGDLLTLGRLAAENPVVSMISESSSLTVAGAGHVSSTNGLLGQHGVTGLKTGTLGVGTANLLYTARLDVGLGEPLSVMGLRLGGATQDAVAAETIALFDSIRAGFRTVDLAAEGDEVGTVTTAWGSSARLVVADDAEMRVWSDTPVTVTLDARTPTSWTEGAAAGTLTWTAGPNTAEAPVAFAGEIEPPDDWWRLTHPELLG